MDQAEASAAADRTLKNARASADFAADLAARGAARAVVLSRGEEGSVLVDTAQRILCTPPPVDVVSAVAAGDSIFANFALARAHDKDRCEALRAGTAAAAAAVMTPGTELCRKADPERLLQDCSLREIGTD